MKFSIVSILLVSSFGWIVKIQNECSCSDYQLQVECISSMSCRWNTSQNLCVDIDCYSMGSQPECLSYPNYCQFDYSSYNCLPFTSCANLKGDTVQECQLQNQICSWVSGNSCIDFNCDNFDLNSCPEFCINTGTICEKFSSCEKLNQVYCQIYSGMCQWNENQCSSYECSNFTTNSQCHFIVKSINVITPCYWNQTDCINPPDSSVLNADQCFFQTAGQYHWSSNNYTTGSCQQCHRFQDYSKQIIQFLSKEFILQIIIIGIILVN